MSSASCANNMKQFDSAPAWEVSQWFNCPQPININQLRGKVILLHTFQLLCPGCVSHGVPQAERVHRLLAGDELVVIGLHSVFEHHAAMTPVVLEAFLHENQITHAVGVDDQKAGSAIPLTMSRYRLRGTPSLVIIDREGKIRLNEFGKVDDLLLGNLLGKLMAASGQTASVAEE